MYIRVATEDNFLYWVLMFGTAGMGEERSQLGNTNQSPKDSVSMDLGDNPASVKSSINSPSEEG